MSIHDRDFSISQEHVERVFRTIMNYGPDENCHVFWSRDCYSNSGLSGIPPKEVRHIFTMLECQEMIKIIRWYESDEYGAVRILITGKGFSYFYTKEKIKEEKEATDLKEEIRFWLPFALSVVAILISLFK